MQTERRAPPYNPAYLVTFNPNRRNSYGSAIGKRVEEELKRRGWTQGQLAAKAHCAQPAISSLIKGDTPDPKSSLTIALATALDLTVEELAGLATPPVNVADDPNPTRAEFEALRTEVRRIREALGVAAAVRAEAAEAVLEQEAMQQEPSTSKHRRRGGRRVG